MRKIRVLVIEDSEVDAELLIHELNKGDFDVEFNRVDTEADLIIALNNASWDIILSDYTMPKFNGMRALSLLNKMQLDIPFILVSGTIGEEKAVEIMKAGGHDYILKDNLTRLNQAVLREIVEAENTRKMQKALQQSEELLRQSQKMEAIGKLAGGVAHDFNNYLSIIGLNCEALFAYCKRDSHAQKQIEQIIKAQKQASEITRQLLIFSRKKIAQLFKIININDIITSSEKKIREIIGQNIKLENYLDPALSTIQADPFHIEQILINLVINAKDAMPNGGTVTIKTKSIYVSPSDTINIVEPGSYVEFHVCDTGYGMGTDTKQKIFDPFFTTKESGKGTGFGLSIVYSFVNQYNGCIFVESEIDKGTTFKLLFPCVTVDSVNATLSIDDIRNENKNEVSQLKATGTILVVDDNIDLQNIICEFLENNGFDVLRASNGKEALTIYETHGDKINLVITSVIMPVMGGIDLLKALRKLNQYIKVLFSSGYSEESLQNDDISLTTIYFIEKPFSAIELVKKVSEILAPAE